jgi:hypothetical protein
MKTATIRATLTTDGSKVLAALGFAAEERGGDPLRSIDRNPKARRTAKVVIISRRDGADVSAADVKAIRAALVK